MTSFSSFMLIEFSEYCRCENAIGTGFCKHIKGFRPGLACATIVCRNFGLSDNFKIRYYFTFSDLSISKRNNFLSSPILRVNRRS